MHIEAILPAMGSSHKSHLPHRVQQRPSQPPPCPSRPKSSPASPLLTSALTFARSVSIDYTYNHIIRALLFGFIIADKPPSLNPRHREAHAIAAILHDVGFPIGLPPHSKLNSEDKRFEVDGANAARDFLRRQGVEAEWDKHRLQLVWDAIALHTIGSVVFHKKAEVQATAHGIWADFQRPDRVAGGLLTWEGYNAVVREFPRLGLMKGLKENMLHICKMKPQTTYDNTVGEWGDWYLSTDEYTRQPNLTQNLLETCDLDDRDPN